MLELDIVKKENERLRLLLASPIRAEVKKMVAEILSVDSDPYSHQVVINRGRDDGIFEGEIMLYVYDKHHLENLIQKLQNIESISQVERMEQSDIS